MSRYTPLFLAFACMPLIARAAADTATGAAGLKEKDAKPAEPKPADAAEPKPADAKPADAAEPKKANRRFSDDDIKKIRALRAEVQGEGDPKPGSPKWSHAKLAEKYGTTAGVISQIVRNRTYSDPNYKPTNDGA